MANEFTSAAGSRAAAGHNFRPRFSLSFDDWITHPAGLGSIPQERLGEEVAIVGAGMSGMVAAYELMKMGLRPVVYEASHMGGRFRSQQFEGAPAGVIAELGGMRFPVSSTAFYHYVDLLGLGTARFPNPLPPRPTARLSISKARRITPSSPAHCRRYSRRWPRLGPMRWKAWGSPRFRMRSGPVMLRA